MTDAKIRLKRLQFSRAAEQERLSGHEVCTLLLVSDEDLLQYGDEELHNVIVKVTTYHRNLRLSRIAVCLLILLLVILTIALLW